MPLILGKYMGSEDSVPKYVEVQVDTDGKIVLSDAVLVAEEVTLSEATIAALAAAIAEAIAPEEGGGV
mgnify:CR=1 FL=1